jgi:Na+-driven multidrug efflux pump
VTLLTHPKFREEVKNTVHLGLPIIAAQLAHIALGFIDTVMAGKLSAKDLGAVAIGRSLYMPLLVFVLGVLLAINPIVAQFRGAMELDKIGKTVRQGLWLSQMIAIPSFFLVRNIHVVMDFMNVAPEVIPITRGYLEAVSWSLPAAFAYLVLRFFNEGISLAKPNMYFTTLAIPINIVGNYAFMYGNWGFPRMGAVGTGWATTTVWWMMLGGMLFMTLTAKTYKPYSIFNNLRLPQWEYFNQHWSGNQYVCDHRPDCRHPGSNQHCRPPDCHQFCLHYLYDPPGIIHRYHLPGGLRHRKKRCRGSQIGGTGRHGDICFCYAADRRHHAGDTGMDFAHLYR